MSAVIQKEYKLGPGGVVGRGGAVYRPGDSIWLTDDEYEKSNKARLTLVSNEGKVVVGEANVDKPALAPVTPSVTTPPPATSATASTDRNWDEFVAQATAESLVTYIQNATVVEIKALRDAEKGRGKQKRAKVVDAANAALRRLNMAKARAVKDARQAEREAAREAKLGSNGGNGDDGHSGDTTTE